MYVLRKLELEEGKISMLETGYVSSLPKLNLFDYKTDEMKEIGSINEIKEGWQIYMTDGIGYRFHRTSPIREIVSLEENRIVFKTQTSVYELIQNNEPEEPKLTLKDYNFVEKE